MEHKHGHVYLSSGEAQGKGAVSEDAGCKSHDGSEDGDLLGEEHFDKALEVISSDCLSNCLNKRVPTASLYPKASYIYTSGHSPGTELDRGQSYFVLENQEGRNRCII